MNFYKIILFPLFTLAIFSFSISFVHAATFMGGGIFEDTVWMKAGNPYVVETTVTVLPEVKLTIEPGVIVKFDYGTSLNIMGSFQAMGTEEDKIYFTSIADDEAGGDTDESMICYEDIDEEGNVIGETS